GIYVVSGATPAIDASVAANTINGGAPTTAESVGILISGAGSNPVISGNSINGGGGGTASFGINVQSDADPTIQNNTSISGGTGGTTYGIYATGAGTNPTIGGAGNGNTLITGGAATAGSSFAINVLAGASPTITANAEINGGTSSTGNTEAIHIDNSTVSITGNLLNGGATSVAGNDAIGINAVGTSGGSIERNRIFAGTALAGGNSTIAINLPGSGTFSVNNNLVSGGQGTNGSSGLYLAGSATVTVRNNTIHTGTAGTASRGVYLVSNNSVTVQNNLIVCTGAAATNIIGFEEAGGATEPSVFRNNNVSDCSTALYRDNNATNITGTSDALDTGEGAGTFASYGNISIAPSFVDFDGADNTSSTSDDFAGTNWDMAAGGVPTNQAQGGLDLSGSGITTDIAGNARTNLGGGQNDGPTNSGANGFTIGAFEDETPALSAPATMYSRASGNYNDPNTWSGSACGGAQPATFASPVAATNVTI
ncbi:MAG: right-handed parallel beta-helix repeat-containing protein, partial [Leptospiraceae bacterium]|nr:right-handed parallel beta-helix repeat-containing protein [Leptospiraceae bacterium]